MLFCWQSVNYSLYMYVCVLTEIVVFPLLISLLVLLSGKECIMFQCMGLATILVHFSTFFHVAFPCSMELVWKVGQISPAVFCGWGWSAVGQVMGSSSEGVTSSTQPLPLAPCCYILLFFILFSSSFTTVLFLPSLLSSLLSLPLLASFSVSVLCTGACIQSPCYLCICSTSRTNYVTCKSITCYERKCLACGTFLTIAYKNHSVLFEGWVVWEADDEQTKWMNKLNESGQYIDWNNDLSNLLTYWLSLEW